MPSADDFVFTARVNTFWCVVSCLLEHARLERLSDWVFRKLAVECKTNGAQSE